MSVVQAVPCSKALFCEVWPIERGTIALCGVVGTRRDPLVDPFLQPLRERTSLPQARHPLALPCEDAVHKKLSRHRRRRRRLARHLYQWLGTGHRGFGLMRPTKLWPRWAKARMDKYTRQVPSEVVPW